jgi:hypothetical protein
MKGVSGLPFLIQTPVIHTALVLLVTTHSHPPFKSDPPVYTDVKVLISQSFINLISIS